MNRRKTLRTTARLLLLVILLSPLVALGCADRIVLGENHEVIDPAGARAARIRVGGRGVEYWIARSPGATGGREPAALVLFFVGKADRADRWITAVAGAWGDRPVEVWGMNYSGSGGSDGPAKLSEVGLDALAVYDGAKRAAGARPIFLHAGSFGTTVALHVAAKRAVAGLILQNPPPLRRLIMGRYGWWNLWALAGPVAAQVPAELDSIANGSRCTAPAIFISAGADRIIPADYHRMVIDAYAGRKHVIEMPGAGHDSPLTREASDGLAKEMDSMWRSAGLGGRG